MPAATDLPPKPLDLADATDLIGDGLIDYVLYTVAGGRAAASGAPAHVAWWLHRLGYRLVQAEPADLTEETPDGR